MSIMQMKSHATATGGQSRWTAGSVVGAAFRGIIALLVLWRSRAAARRRLRAPRHLDDRLLADIGLTRIDLKLPTPDLFFWW